MFKVGCAVRSAQPTLNIYTVLSMQLLINTQCQTSRCVTKDNKDIQIPSKHNKIYYTLPLLDYMFRPFGVIIRSSSELIQNYLIPSALCDPVALTIVGVTVLWVHVCYYSVYGYLCYYITM